MTTLLRDLAECADEIGACGAGNEAAVVRKAMAEIASLRAQLDEARAAFTQIREHTKNVVDDDLISVIDMIAEDFLDPSKRAPLRALLSESKT